MKPLVRFSGFMRASPSIWVNSNDYGSGHSSSKTARELRCRHSLKSSFREESSQTWAHVGVSKCPNWRTSPTA
jgi:hypothetical protein